MTAPLTPGQLAAMSSQAAEGSKSLRSDLRQSMRALLAEVERLRRDNDDITTALMDSDGKRWAGDKERDCGAGCGTDHAKACLRCCRIMLSNYDTNHGERCDAEQERLRCLAEEALTERDEARGEVERLLQSERERISDLEDERDAAIRERDEARADLADMRRTYDLREEEWIVGRADCDAARRERDELRAERDALQQRLDAVVAEVRAEADWFADIKKREVGDILKEPDRLRAIADRAGKDKP